MKLAIIGVGLIGGSFAKALRAQGEVERIVGFDTCSEVLRQAIKRGVIDDQATSAAQAAPDADVIVVASPVGTMREVFHQIAGVIKPTAIVTDVGSVKGCVIDAARDTLGAAFARFVPGHPIAGSERSGVEHADAALLRERVFVSTPLPQTESQALHRVEELWRSVGCRVERMTPDEHDRVMASVSHLPHLLAFAFMAQIAGQIDAVRKFALAGPGFRDFTRIAGSNATMWSEICICNRKALGDELRAHRDLLADLALALDRGDREALRRVFLRAADARPQ